MKHYSNGLETSYKIEATQQSSTDSHQRNTQLNQAFLKEVVSHLLFSTFFSATLPAQSRTQSKPHSSLMISAYGKPTNPKKIQTQLQDATKNINNFSIKWGLVLNKAQTFYTVFTTTLLRKTIGKNTNLTCTRYDTK